MKILSMRASFGKLQNEELTLHEGLNIITAPNESGKSTWASFLLAMFYGIDSSERATRTNLPAKTKYRPWSGAAMEGRVELEWNGRRIALERTGKPRAPMSEFRAYDLDTMQPIAGMTGENCGQMLFGVGRSVFERSAFLAQGGAAVTSDAALEQRLAALVTSGDERVSYSETRKRLNDLKNHCRHYKTGLIPETTAALSDVEERLRALHDLHKDDLTLAAQQQTLSARQDELTLISQSLAAQRAAREARTLEDAQIGAERAAEESAALLEKTAMLPSEQTLETLSRELTLLQHEKSQLPAELPPTPAPPECPEVFRGLRAEEILPKAQRDAETCRRLCGGKYRSSVVFIIFAVLALLAALSLFVAKRYMFAILPIVFCAVCIACILRNRAKNRAREACLDEADRLMRAYALHSADEFVAFAASYHEALLVYRHKLDAAAQQKSALDAQIQNLAAREARLLGQISMFAPQAETIEAAISAVSAAQEQYRALHRAQQTEKERTERVLALRAALGERKTVFTVTVNTDGYDEQRVAGELKQIAQSLAHVRSQQDLSRGKAAALGDPARLQAQQESLAAKLQSLEARYDALSLAMQTLDEANDDLQTRFAPQLASLAGSLLSQLTEARYDAVLLDRDLRAEARQSGEPVTRQLLSLSGGTVDQVYLAVRLAICRLALGEDVPMVLDDALVRFDDARLRAALSLLRRESRSRQILLFTCQSREQAAVDAGLDD